MSCTWCGNAVTHKHHDPEKARKGLTICPACNMVHSPEATIKGTYAYWDGKKIVTGIRRPV
jgi:hypothetical protein